MFIVIWKMEKNYTFLLTMLQHSSAVMTGDTTDVVRISRQILNRSIAHRTIPKQECMVELAGLPLTLCSEHIEPVNISGSYHIKSTL